MIAHGTVISKTIQRDANAQIFTELEIEAREIWKGEWKGRTVPVVRGGGVLGDEGVTIVGQAEYRVGEEVVLFLKPNEKGRFVTVGMSWGKFEVESGTATQAGVSSSKPIPLSYLKSQVREPIAND